MAQNEIPGFKERVEQLAEGLAGTTEMLRKFCVALGMLSEAMKKVRMNHKRQRNLKPIRLVMREAQSNKFYFNGRNFFKIR